MNSLKTTLLLVGLMVLLMGFGYAGFGRGGMIVAFVLATVMNAGVYWFGDKIVLRQYQAREIEPEEAPQLHRVVSRLAERGGIPVPDLYLIPDDNPNAFAAGRNPENAVVGVTQGLLELLEEDELEGVLAHELSHVINRDTLVSTVAATLAGAVTLLATMARWSALFGFGGRGRNSNLIVLIVMAIVAPIAATIVQLAISRTREFKADRSGAQLSGRPMSLARALRKLAAGSEDRPMQVGNAQSAHLFIVNPFSAGTFRTLFSTHPDVEERVEQLERLARDQS